MVKKALQIAFWCVFALAGRGLGDQIAVGQFKGINNNEPSVVIGQEYAQDILNVDVTPGGKSVKKRPGYGLYKQLYSSQLNNVHGGHHFFDGSGNDVQVWGSSTSVYGIVADATPTQLVSSATLNSTLDCVDIQGYAYCATSSKDFLLKTDGATKTWYTTALGTMVEATPDRLAVAGVASNLSTLYISGANSFTNFTSGALPTDPFTEVIAAPGSKLTHIRWGCGKLLWWKDQSFGYFAFEDQFTAEVKTISDTIGTFDNTSAIDPGGSVWFRGQDGHVWEYNCSGLIKQSIEITPNVQASGRRTANSWEQTTQSDWNSGGVLPVLQLSTAIASGDVVPGSFTVTENSAASGWSSGSNSNFAVGTSSLSLVINNSGDLTNPDFEDDFTGNWVLNVSTYTNLFLQFPSGGGTLACGSRTSQSGSFHLGSGGQLSNGVGGASFQAITTDELTTLQSVSPTLNNGDCTYRQSTLTPSASNVGKRVKFRFYINDTANNQTVYQTTSDSYIWGGPITFWCRSYSSLSIDIDNVQAGSSTITSGSFTSQIFNTGLTSATYSLSNFAWTVNTSTPTFALLTSTANPTNNWVTTLTSSGTNAVGNKYARYVATITITNVDNALTSITAATILARSSGTLYSAWKNVPTWTAWSTFVPVTSDGDGSHTFYVRSSTSPQSVLNSTVAWVAQPANALVATSTSGIYFQIRDDFTIGAATNTPTLNSFLVNWFEGTATDQAYMLYFDNAILASVAYGAGVSSNTYIFKRDLINDGWTLYNIGTGGMLVQNNHLFFGDVSANANIFQYDSGNSDNGSAINAFWRSKSFTGSDPFLQNALTNIDVFARQNTGQSLTATYTLDTSTTSTSYAINLSSTTQSIIQSRKLLPSGKTGYVFDFKLGDESASSSWEVLGWRIGYTQNPYRPSQ